MPPFDPPNAIPLFPDKPPSIDDMVEKHVEDALNASSGLIQINGDDGGISFVEPSHHGKREETPENWFRNLADELDRNALATIGHEVVDGVEADDRSREQWLKDRAEIIEMLGLKLQEPRTSVAGDGGQLAGMSSVQSPLMLESVLNFQANACAELLPSDGPVKVAIASSGAVEADEEAQSLEGALNYYLTNVASEYYPDTTRMIFSLGYGGCGIKKVYRCPIRRRPVSESIDPSDFIVNSTATDLRNATRIAHRIKMPRSTLRRMQLVGAYRDIDLGEETHQEPNAVDEVKANQQGIAPTVERPEDVPYDLYEVYCELEVPGFEDQDKGEPTGLYLPWKVTVHAQTREVLEIRRNWNPDDDMKRPREVFVKFTFVEGMGFYGIGLGHILGNTERSLTAMTRLGIDNGMFANFPGFLFAKGISRQNTNEVRVPPGGGYGIDTNGMAINQAVMPLPYKDITQAFVQLQQAIEAGGQRLGGSAQIQVGEGKQDAPVGTTLAMIEQATKAMSAVHKNMHMAQAKEFEMLVDLFREDPLALWRGKKGRREDWDENRIVAALDRSDIAPKADPNTPSNLHRMMKAQALLNLSISSPNINRRAAEEYALRIMGFSDIDKLMPQRDPNAKPQVPPTDQAALMVGKARLMDAQTKQAKVQVDAKKVQADAMLKARQMQLNAAKENVPIQNMSPVSGS